MMSAICAPYGAGATGWPPQAASRRYAAAAPRESGPGDLRPSRVIPVFMTGLRISCSMHTGTDAGSPAGSAPAGFEAAVRYVS